MKNIRNSCRTLASILLIVLLSLIGGVPTARAADTLAGPLVNLANQHQYYLLQPATWSDAESTAVAMSGHLVTINDQEEHFWVRDTFSSYAGTNRALWIGLSDPAPWLPNDGSWAWCQHFVWASGQPVTFFCWSTMGQSSQGSGRMKMCRPDPSWPSGQGEWAEEADSTLLNAVVEVPLPLEIISQPQSVSVGIGRDVTLVVVADGTAAVQYQWQFMGKDIPGETTAKLSLTNAQPSQSGPYCVVLSNEHGTLTSAMAFVSVQGIVGWGMSPFGVFDVPASVTNVVQIASGVLHSLALRADGTVIAWGDNRDGQTDVPDGLTNVQAVSAGEWHNLALKKDGTVIGWGATNAGQCLVPASLTNVVSVAGGGNFSLALQADGTVVAWGDYVVPSWAFPEIVATLPAGLTNVVGIAAGGLYSLALKADGTVVAGGYYSISSMNGTLSEVPAYVPDGLTNVVAVAAGQYHSLALKSDGTVEAWGQDDSGDTIVPAGLANVVAIDGGNGHSMALKADGTVVEWGQTIGDVPRPSDLPNIVAIAAGGNFSIALLRDGAPNLTVQPWDLAVTNGANPSFVGKAVGSQSMSYQWQFNGNTIEGATHDTLSISNAQATDAGVYSLSVSNEVGVIISRHAKLVVGGISSLNTNHPPVLAALSDCTVNELTELLVTNTATDPDSPPQPLSYELVNPPPGVNVDSNGIIRWIPSEEQGPGRFLIITIATKPGDPSLSTTNGFYVTVNEVNSSPALPAQTDLMIGALNGLAIVNTASDPDIPANSLSYQLIDPPQGASIDAAGVIHWTPARAQGPSTNLFTTVVTDDGVPPLSATNSFNVIVSAPSLVAVPAFTINPGQSVSLTNLATDNDTTRLLNFSLDAAPTGATIGTGNGVFSWRAPVERAGTSNYVQVRVTDDSAIALSDSQGFAILINPLQPTVLEPGIIQNGAFHLRVSGTIGPDYILQASDGETGWMDLQTNRPSATPFEFVDTDAPAHASRFYRVCLGP